MLPPSDMFRDYFFVSLTGKNLTITIPKVDREASVKTQYDLYNVLTSDRIFQVVVAHQYDTVERNFTVIGEKVEPPSVLLYRVVIKIVSSLTTKNSMSRNNILY
ncbi:hypothetical protein DPMN_071233 [Dreissena polymorpha]|uniref:Uncharacterized protein n=1 Tax=Dreissena polymorpha TaxID=45954 RepID=A0A9D3Z485_DREPO|nr:hypothetical protein DPMN_071233 [Dreissena polymorpha]